MKKAFRRGVVILCFIMMLCVWPFCLVRKEGSETSALGVDYGYTEQFITHNAPYMQSFTARASVLNEIAFTVGYDDELPENGSLLFELLDESEKVIFNKKIEFSGVGHRKFYSVPIELRLQTGHEYTYKISVEEEYNNLLYGIYTLQPEHHAGGSVRLCIGEEEIPGQGLASYNYDYPLNIKNIICLWAFIWIIGLSVYGMLHDSKAKTGKLQNALEWLWRFVERYQIPILALEMLGIAIMTILICRNNAMDWDEAYSVGMVVRTGFKEMLQITAEDVHPPLYYILLRGFGVLFGTSVFSFKMMSFAFTCGVMLLGVTHIRKNWGVPAAILFNLIIGLGPQFLFYSMDLRMYSMAFLFTTWCACLAYEILQGKNRWILFTLSALGGAYTHYYAIIPIALICAYLLLGLLLEKPKECKYFVGVCIGIILGYLPWLRILLSTADRWGNSVDTGNGALEWRNLFASAFSTNMKWSEYTPVILFGFAVAFLLVEWKKNSRQQNLFLTMCALIVPISYIVCKGITSTMGHFWSDRYVFCSTGLFWLFLIIIYTRREKMVVCVLAIWICMTAMSSYVVQKGKETATIDYLNETYQILEQVRGEETILYNYSSYDVLYGAHLREQEFVFIDDVDWENLEQDYLYFIAWGSHWFDAETIYKYDLEFADCGTMRFEEGVAGVKLYKVIKNASNQ